MSEPESRQHWLQSIVQRYEKPLLAYACRLLAGDVDRAQDIVQETLLRLCRATPEEIADRIPPWLFTVCRSRVIDMRRSEHGTALLGDSVIGEDANPANIVEKQDTVQQIQQLVTRLPARQQELLHLRLHAGLSYQQISEATGLTVTNVGYQLHQAIRALRNAMQTVPT
jgi:RNA polymerase sigma-70 factor (ECF subfamily)